INENSPTPKRIPVRFVDEESDAGYETSPEAGDDDALSPEELGRASSYEGETEMRQRIERGQEQDSEQGKTEADDRDTAGGPARSEIPEERNEQDTNSHLKASHPDGEEPTTTRNSHARGGASSTLAMQAELFAAQAEIEMIEAELQKVKAEHQELHDSMTRRQADFDNYRKRVERERSETYNRVVADVVGNLLPVIDNLRRAHEAESSVESTESQEFRNFLHGVELISKQLNGVLEHFGIEQVPTVGHPFDPHVHEAIATEQTDEFEPDTVMQEIVRGYRLGDKLLRPAMVKVATK
ncbi:MAG: nucleotide exchange factor GrpE, partial [Acidobacteria bacterium]|nr:nucleotide exchange factor GrpE [Acidobacteriota bacterium]